MYTFQDFMDTKGKSVADAVQEAISRHKSSFEFMISNTANEYDAQRNVTILHYVHWLYSMNGEKMVDTTASNNRLCSNFFNRLNTQRMTYSLGNGVTFEQDGLKEKLGEDFDTRLRTAGYYALIHGLSFIFWNVDHIHVFPFTEFAPLWDEETGALRAGVRYWQVDSKKPVIAILYEEDGFTRYKGDCSGSGFEEVEPKRAYRIKTVKAEADAEPEIVGEENYGSLPIVPLYGSRLKQSTLVGMQSKIDSYDLIQSGFANDLEDCAEIYWLIGNAGASNDSDLAKFRDRLKLQHIAAVQDTDETPITPYTQELPYAARKTFLDDIRASIYDDFGGLDVHTVAAGATNDHIDAAYQPMDENADDFEYQVIEAVQALLQLQGIEAGTPVFKRNRISNQKETVEMVMLAANYLDDETILTKLPFLTPDEIDGVMQRKEEQDEERISTEEEEITVDTTTEEESGETLNAEDR